MHAVHQEIQIEPRTHPRLGIVRVGERTAFENSRAHARIGKRADDAHELVVRDALAQGQTPARGVDERINARADGTDEQTFDALAVGFVN